jgi:uncharacterized membrane protein
MDETTPGRAGLSPRRLEALADGIFAIAMTLLVLELRVPEVTGPGDLASRLVDLWPRFATFFISFVVLGVYWFAHHQTFYFLVRVNRTLVWLSILFFLGAVLIPFVASLLGSYPLDPVALGLYGAVLGLVAIVGYVIWWYITGDRGLIDEKLDPDLVRKVHRWIGAGPSIMPVAIGMAFVAPVVSLLIYLALPALFVLFNPVDSYLERLRQSAR